MGAQRTPQVLGGCHRREQHHRVRALLVGVFRSGGEGGVFVSPHVAGLGGCYGRRLILCVLSLLISPALSHTFQFHLTSRLPLSSPQTLPRRGQNGRTRPRLNSPPHGVPRRLHPVDPGTSGSDLWEAQDSGQGQSLFHFGLHLDSDGVLRAVVGDRDRC
jgi:hypothetical protein